MTTCICSSGKPFARCCGRFLQQGQHAKTPEQLMRSRFAAYALGGYGQYLLDTWHASMRAGLSVPDLNQRTTQWTRLAIIDKSQKGNVGFVEFNAFFNDENGDEQVFAEHSEFVREHGRWFYLEGEIKGSDKR